MGPDDIVVEDVGFTGGEFPGRPLVLKEDRSNSPLGKGRAGTLTEEAIWDEAIMGRSFDPGGTDLEVGRIEEGALDLSEDLDTVDCVIDKVIDGDPDEDGPMGKEFNDE